MQAEALPPHSMQAESAILGAMLSQPRAAEIACDEMHPADFYVPGHRGLFGVMAALIERGKNIEPALVQMEARECNVAVDVGALYEQPDTAANIEEYCRRVKDFARRRDLLELGMKLQARCHSGNAEELAALAEGVIGDVWARLRGVNDSGGWLEDGAKKIAESALSGKARACQGMPFGFCGSAFDDLTGGAVPGSYWVLAGRASMGKSTFAAALCRSLRQTNPDAGCPLYVTTEMSFDQMCLQSLASEAGVHSKALTKRNLTSNQRSQIEWVFEQRRLEGIAVQDLTGKTVGAVRAAAKRHKAKHGLPLLVVDLAGKLKGSGGDRREILNSISQGLHELKADLNTCIIATVQINRSVMHDTDKRPHLHHLKDSGCWEEDADKVILLHRPGYYGADDKRTEVIQAKDRLNIGGVDSIYVQYRQAIGQFAPARGNDGGEEWQ